MKDNEDNIRYKIMHIKRQIDTIEHCKEEDDPKVIDIIENAFLDAALILIMYMFVLGICLFDDKISIYQYYLYGFLFSSPAILDLCKDLKELHSREKTRKSIYDYLNNEFGLSVDDIREIRKAIADVNINENEIIENKLNK